MSNSTTAVAVASTISVLYYALYRSVRISPSTAAAVYSLLPCFAYMLLLQCAVHSQEQTGTTRTTTAAAPDTYTPDTRVHQGKSGTLALLLLVQQALTCNGCHLQR
jgi:hypothetical protein